MLAQGVVDGGIRHELVPALPRDAVTGLRIGLHAGKPVLAVEALLGNAAHRARRFQLSVLEPLNLALAPPEVRSLGAGLARAVTRIHVADVRTGGRGPVGPRRPAT